MVILGLGSNIGDRLGYLRAAVRRLSELLEDVRPSRVLESAALLPPEATPDMNRPYLNMALAGTTRLAPEALLKEAKAIERALGRTERCKWGPREIDIDLLAVDNVILKKPGLEIPHPELLNRDFALLPLAEIAPDWSYPLPGRYFGWMAADIVADKGFRLGDSLRDTGFIIDA